MLYFREDFEPFRAKSGVREGTIDGLPIRFTKMQMLAQNFAHGFCGLQDGSTDFLMDSDVELNWLGKLWVSCYFSYCHNKPSSSDSEEDQEPSSEDIGWLGRLWLSYACCRKKPLSDSQDQKYLSYDEEAPLIVKRGRAYRKYDSDDDV